MNELSSVIWLVLILNALAASIGLCASETGLQSFEEWGSRLKGADIGRIHDESV